MDSNHTLFITGATGQLGAFILAELLGHGPSSAFQGSVICARRASSSFGQLEMVEDFMELDRDTLLKSPQVHWVEMDISDGHHSLDRIQDYCTQHNLPLPQSVIHAAATIDISPSASKGASNEKITDQMLLLAQFLEVDHFTHISSIAVMGGTALLGDYELLGPADFHPNRSDSFLSSYALGKIASELRVWSAHASGQSVSIIRPGVIMGIGPKDRAPQELWARLYHGKLPLATDGSTGVVDVRDTAAIVVNAHINKVEGPVVAVAGNITFDTLLAKMSSALGQTKKLWFLPSDPWLDRMRALGWLRKFPFIGTYFTPQMRIMLFSKTEYDGTSGGELHPYREIQTSISDFGAFLKKVWA